MDQAKVTLPSLAQKTLETMTQHTDRRAFDRWNSMLEKDQVERLMDKYQEYGKHVVTGKWQTNRPSIAPELERPPSEAASSSHRNQAQKYQRKGSGSGKSSKGQGTSWRRIEWNHRSWNTYGTTFNDDHWNNTRIKEARQDWYEWERDQGARDQPEEHHDDDDEYEYEGEYDTKTATNPFGVVDSIHSPPIVCWEGDPL